MKSVKWLLYIGVMVACGWAFAQAEKSAFEATLERDTAMNTEESWVEIKSVRYRKIEFQGARYYLRFSSPEATSADLYCTPPTGYQNEHLVIAAPESVHRSRAFLQVFHERCQEGHGQTAATSLKLDPSIGLTYPETKKASK